MDESGNLQRLLDLDNICRTIMKGYSFLYDTLIGWYPERLYTELHNGWAEVLYAEDSSGPFATCLACGMPEALFLLLNNKVFARSTLALIFMLVAYAVYAYSGKAKFFLESFRSEVFKMVAFYIFVALPLQNIFPPKFVRKVILPHFNFAIIEIINLLLCIFIYYCFNYAIRKFDKMHTNPHSSTYPISSSHVCILFETDPETRIEVKLVVRDDEYFETLVERITPRIIVSLCYLHTMQMILLLFTGNPIAELITLLFLTVLGYFLIGSVSGNAYGNGIIYNYINIYFIPFLAFLMQILCVAVCVLTMMHAFFPNSGFKDRCFSFSSAVFTSLFSQNIDPSSILAKSFIAFAFIVYCICDANKNKTLDSYDEIKKSYRIFENLKIYLYYAGIVRTTPLRLILPSSLAELCCEKEYRKLVHAHFKAINKFHDLKDLMRSRTRITLSAYNSSQTGTGPQSGPRTADALWLNGQVQQAKHQKNLLVKLYKVSFGLAMNYFRLFKKDALNSPGHIDE